MLIARFFVICSLIRSKPHIENMVLVVIWLHRVNKNVFVASLSYILRKKNKNLVLESQERSKNQIYENRKKSVFQACLDVFWGSNFGSKRLKWVIFHHFFFNWSHFYGAWPKNDSRGLFLPSSWKKNYLISLQITKDWDPSRSSMVDYKNELVPLFPGLGGEPAGCLTSDRVHS